MCSGCFVSPCWAGRGWDADEYWVQMLRWVERGGARRELMAFRSLTTLVGLRTYVYERIGEEEGS